MNLQQLEYILAVDRLKNFVRASEACFVTQATLSMMIKKLEEELEVKIFDRSKQPVTATDIGEKILLQAQRILEESGRLKELVREQKNDIRGELRLGIIPTLAPYLLPLFLKKLIQLHPGLRLIIHEFTTEVALQKLKSGELDIGLLATPLQDRSVNEQPLFYEKYFLYIHNGEKGFDKQYVLPRQIDLDRLWLLEEGHCMRSQILNFCELKKQHSLEDKLIYSAGSIETLKNMVDKDFGMTILPELATLNFSKAQKKQLRYFKAPQPVREISIVTHRTYIKLQLIQAFKEVLLSVIPPEMKSYKNSKVLEINSAD